MRSGGMPLAGIPIHFDIPEKNLRVTCFTLEIRSAGDIAPASG